MISKSLSGITLKRYVLLITLTFIYLFAFQAIGKHVAHAYYKSGNLIDNATFLDARSMNPDQIQNFLANKGGGIASASFLLNCDVAGTQAKQAYLDQGAPCGQTIAASRIIYYSAQVYGLNPKVILATLQKEQSLITAPNPTDWQYSQAMGYSCPTSGSCSSSSNFFWQIDNGTWALRFHYERAQGNNNWWYTSSWTCGTSKSLYTPNLYPGQNVNFYDTNGVMYQTVYINNAATSALYCYTPHTFNNHSNGTGPPQNVPAGTLCYSMHPPLGTTGQCYTGSYNFVKYFELWFDPASTIWNNVTMTVISQPNTTPARGQTVTYTVAFKNNASTDIAIDALGVVGRAGSFSGTNRDYGWQGPVTLVANTTQQYTFTTTIKDIGVSYMWPAILYQGVYVQYNNWGSTLNSHAPNITFSQALTATPSNVYAGQDVTFTAVIKNNEPNPINYDALGIPVKFYDRYNYDAYWTGPGTLAAGQELTLSGIRNIEKAGPYSYWVSNYFAGTYSTIGDTSKLTAIEATPNFSVAPINLSSTSPVIGQDLSATISVTNNLPVPIDVEQVGVVGRFGSFTGPNRDIGWQGPIHFNAGETKTFTGYSRTITDLGTHYYWIGILYKGNYIQYNNWGSTVVSQSPNFSVAPISFNTTSPLVGQNLDATISVTNKLSVPIDVEQVGVVGRFGSFTGPNRDIGWQGPIHFNAGETKTFTGYSRTITDLGTHYYWIGILYKGNYIQYNNWGSTVVSRSQ